MEQNGRQIAARGGPQPEAPSPLPEQRFPVHGWQLNEQQRGQIRDLREVWHRLAMHLLRSDRARAPRVIGMTSAGAGEGKTTNSIGLASALAAESGKPVALVEANVHNATLAADFGMSPAPGLLDNLSGRYSLREVARQTGIPGLDVLPAGLGLEAAAGANAVSSAARIRRGLPTALIELREQYDRIIVDLPSVLGSMDTEEMVRDLDGALLVVRAGVTTLDRVRQAAQLIPEAGLLGVIHVGPPSTIPQWLSRLILD